MYRKVLYGDLNGRQNIYFFYFLNLREFSLFLGANKIIKKNFYELLTPLVKNINKVHTSQVI